jgi:hypothetical protein
MKHQTDMSIRRRTDDDCIDIGSLNRRDGIKRGLATKMIGQVPGRGAVGIGNRDKLCLGISRHIGRVDFPNSSSTENRNAQHIGNSGLSLGLTDSLRQTRMDALT